MPDDRVQRQIDRLLDFIKEAVAMRDDRAQDSRLRKSADLCWVVRPMGQPRIYAGGVWVGMVRIDPYLERDMTVLPVS